MRTLRLVFASLLLAPAAGLSFAACGGSVESGGLVDTDTGTGSDVAVIDGAGDGGTTDTTTPGDTSVPPTDAGTIKCGSEACNPATQECCAGTSGLKCLDKGKCGGGTVIPCSDPSACPSGQVCCAAREGFGVKVACQATCSGTGSFELCSSDADCEAPEKCVNGVGGFKVCASRPDGGGFDGGGFDVGGFFDTKPG